jgi:hypothetical protein
MSKISGEIVLKCSREKVFGEMSLAGFAKKLDPASANLNVEILFQNDRLLRTLTKIENIGNIDMEKVKIPENFTMVSLRKPPMAPFAYFIGILIFLDHKEGTLLKWIEEFEVDADNKSKEEGIAKRLEQNENLHFQKVRNYFSNESE